MSDRNVPFSSETCAMSAQNCASVRRVGSVSAARSVHDRQSARTSAASHPVHDRMRRAMRATLTQSRRTGGTKVAFPFTRGSAGPSP